MLDDLKKCSDVLIPDVRPPLVSLAADDAASRIPVDLLQAGWHDQPKFDVGRKVFHWEHVTPLAQLRDSLVRAATAEQVQSMISARLYVAWITKDEDHALTAAGFKSKRPQPWAAYDSCGIALTGKPVSPLPPQAPTASDDHEVEFDGLTVGIRLLEAVARLHSDGYQHLRVFPGMSASGLHWRLAVAPKEHFDASGELHTLDLGFVYSTAAGGVVEGVDIKRASPAEVGAVILGQIPEATPSRDWAYAGWHQELVQLARRHQALPIAYADWFDPTPGWEVGWGSGVRLPWPP